MPGPPSLPLQGLGGAARGGPRAGGTGGGGTEAPAVRANTALPAPHSAAFRSAPPSVSPSRRLRRLGNTASSAHPRMEAAPLRLGIPGSAHPGLLAPLGRAPSHLQPRRRRRLPHPAARNGDRVL